MITTDNTILRKYDSETKDQPQKTTIINSPKVSQEHTSQMTFLETSPKCFSSIILFSLDSKYFISEIRYSTKRRRTYLTVLSDESRLKVQKVQLDSLKMQAYVIQKLIIGALEFIESMHSLGCRVFSPLEQFLQVERSARNQNVSFVRIRRLDLDESKKTIGQPHIESISQEQLRLLGDFYNKIRRKNKKMSTDRVLDSLFNLSPETSFHGALELTTTALTKQLTQFEFQKNGCTLFCYFDTKRQVLQAEFHDKKNKEVKKFIQSQLAVFNSKETLNAESFFYFLTTRQENQLQMPSIGIVQFWNEDCQQWKTVIFKDEEVDEDMYEQQGWSLEENEKGWEIEKVCEIKNKNSKEKVLEIVSQRKQKLVIKKDIQKYPYNRLTQVVSKFHFQRGYFAVLGVGTLISQNLVLTCAHNVYHKLKMLNERVQACQIDVKNGTNNIKVSKFMFPQEYRRHNFRDYDYSLLLLQQKVSLDESLFLNKKFRSQRSLQLPTFYHQQSDQLQIQVQNAKMELPERQILKHMFQTTQGDSGTPLIVQFSLTDPTCYIVGIHAASIRDQNSTNVKMKKAVRISEEVIDRLKQFQLAMKKTQFSMIEMFTLAWEHGEDNNTAIQLEKVKNQVKYQFGIFQSEELNENQIIPTNLTLIKNKCQQWLNLHSIIERMEQSIYQTEIEDEELQKYKALKSKLEQYCMYNEEIIFLSRLKQFIWKWVTSYNSQDINHPLEIFSCMRWVEQSCQLLIPWDSLILFFNQKGVKDSVVIPYLRFMEMMIQQSYIVEHLWKMVRLTRQTEGHDDRISKINLLDKVKQQMQVRCPQNIRETIVFPFQSLQKTMFYSAINNDEWRLVLKFDNKKILDKTFWQLTLFRHPFKLLPFGRRCKQNDQRFYLLTNYFMKPPTFKTISECVCAAKFTLKNWISILLKVTQCIICLHKENYQLCLPLQRCMLIDTVSMNPVFFCHQSFQALSNQVLKLSAFQKKILKQFVPLNEIADDRQIKNKAQKVDIWMLGKSIERLLTAIKNQKQSIKFKITMKIASLQSHMLCQQSQRIDIVAVNKKLVSLKKDLSSMPSSKVKVDSLEVIGLQRSDRSRMGDFNEWILNEGQVQNSSEYQIFKVMFEKQCFQLQTQNTQRPSEQNE